MFKCVDIMVLQYPLQCPQNIHFNTYSSIRDILRYCYHLTHRVLCTGHSSDRICTTRPFFFKTRSAKTVYRFGKDNFFRFHKSSKTIRTCFAHQVFFAQV